jgi:hypothetical protein
MDVTVAISAERDQIFAGVVTQPAARANVMDLETIGTTAVLASPSIPFEHFGAEPAVGILVEAKPRPSLPNRFHAVFSTCRRNSIF